MEDNLTMQIEWIDGSPWYVAPNGWRHTFVGGGEDNLAPSAVADGAPPAGDGSDGSQSTDPAAGQTQEPETFKREYVEELRRENARHRTTAKELEDRVKEYDSAFSAYTPEERAVLLDITRQLSDPATQPAVAKRLQAIADNILKGGDIPKRPTGEEDPNQKPLTRAEWERLQQERDQEQQVNQLLDEVESLGYKPGTPDHAAFMAILMEPDVAGVVSKAQEKMNERKQAERQAIIDEYVKSVQEGKERWPGSNTGALPGFQPPAETPKTPREATKAAMAALAARAGAV